MHWGGGSKENEGREEAKHRQAGETKQWPCIVRVERPSITVSLKREKEAESEGVRAGCIKEAQQNLVRRVLHLAGH